MVAELFDLVIAADPKYGGEMRDRARKTRDSRRSVLRNTVEGLSPLLFGLDARYYVELNRIISCTIISLVAWRHRVTNTKS